MGSDVFAYFTLQGGRATSAELEELARDSGSSEVAADADQVVTRLDPATRAREGESLNVWFDARKVHVFDPHSGENVTTEAVAGTNDGARSPAAASDPAPQTDPEDGGRHESNE
jgi:multiple sugar transport system ATP-binding protein